MSDIPYGALRGLVVDDDPVSRALTAALLKQLGFREIKEAESGLAALSALRGFPADVVLCDMVMEPMDGVSFLTYLRTNSMSPNPYVPVIIVTGRPDKQTVREARDAGVNALLAKPVTLEALRRRIDTVMTEPRDFIVDDSYVGPDRRRQHLPLSGRSDRRRD